jgi:LysM repeat protein
MSQPIKPGSTYTVQPGDTLWDIAQRAYADPEDWDTIYNANKQVIGNDPNLIKPGQVLHIPAQSDPHKTPVPSPGPKPKPQPQPNLYPPPDPNLNPYPSPANPTPTPVPTPQPSGKDDDDNIFDQAEDAIEKELGEKKDD